MALPRHCNICGKRYQPRTRYNKLCEKCCSKIKKGCKSKKNKEK